MSDIKKLIESIDKIAFSKQVPGDQVRGTETGGTDRTLKQPYKGKQHPFKGRLVGEEDSENKFLGEPYIREDENDEYSHDAPEYARRVQELEDEGLTTSDAQSVADVEYRMKKGPWAIDENYLERMRGGASDIVEDDEQSPLTYEDMVSAWKHVFPNSSVGVSKAFDGGYYFKFRLAKDKTEVASGILDNDPLSYSAFFTNNNFKENSISLFVKPPVGSYLAYGNEKLRKKTILNVSIDALIKRFTDVKSFIAANADKLKNPMFDINEKLGNNISEDDDYRDSYYNSDDTELYDGCYVRDVSVDNPNGEIFKMRGDPGNRNVRIEDKDGRGWYVSPTRLSKVYDENPMIADYFPSENKDEYIDEAARPVTVIAKLKKAKENGTINADQISKDKEGNFIFRRGFYYRHGFDSAKFAATIDEQLSKLGIAHEILSNGEHYAAFKGGASIKASSHWWVKIRILDSIPARSTISVNNTIEESLEEITEELRTAFEDYVKNKSEKEDKKERVTITYKDGHTQTKLVTPKEKQSYETSSHVSNVAPAKDSKSRIDDAKLDELAIAFKESVNKNKKTCSSNTVRLKFETINFTDENKLSRHLKQKFINYHKDGLMEDNYPRPGRLSGFRHMNEDSTYDSLKQYFMQLESLGLKNTAKVKVGDKLAILYFDANFGFHDVDLYGFIEPEEIVHIEPNTDGTIKFIKFSSGRQFPRAPLASYNGKIIDYSILFRTQNEARSALTFSKTAIPSEWTLNDHTQEHVEESTKLLSVQEARKSASSRLLGMLADKDRIAGRDPEAYKNLKTKFDDLTQKLDDVKSQLAAKKESVEEDFPTNLAPAGTQTDPNNPNTGQIPTTGTNPKPIAAQPKTTAQQIPVTAGTPTAAPGVGQPTPPTAGQAGGAPTTASAGAPQPPTGGQVNAATTPAEQMKGFLNTITSNPAAAKALATKINSTLR